MTADYSRGLIKQLEELTLENEVFKKENSLLRAENKSLRKRIETLESSIDSRMEKTLSGILEKTVIPLRDEIIKKDIVISKLNNEVLRLKSIIAKDSENSSKPPSTNGFKKILNSREKSLLKSGGQKGHKGHKLELPDNLNELIKKGLAEKRLVDHTGGNSEYISRYEIDIDIKAIYTEYRFPVGTILPNKFCNNISYGNNLKALIVLLANEGVIAGKRLQTILNDITGGALCLSEASLINYSAQFSEKLQSEIEAIKTDLLNGKVMNVDETPMRSYQILKNQGTENSVLESEKNTTFSANIRNYSNETTTLYTVNPKKDKLGIKLDNILPNFFGTLSHDHDKKYYKYGTHHASCGAHLMRELRALSELYLCPWANIMLKFLSKLNQHKNQDLENNVIACSEDFFTFVSAEYDLIIKDGESILSAMSKNKFGRDQLRKMLNRLKKYKTSYLMFLMDYEAPFTNNLSERDLRPCKTKQKISGCFRSWAGIVNYARIRSFISTVKKRSLNLLNSIALIFNGEPVLSEPVF